MLVLAANLRLFAKVHPHPTSQDRLAIEDFPDLYRILSREKCDYDSAETLERRKLVDVAMLAYGFPYAV